MITRFLYYLRISYTLMIFGWLIEASIYFSLRSEAAACTTSSLVIFSANFLLELRSLQAITIPNAPAPTTLMISYISSIVLWFFLLIAGLNSDSSALSSSYGINFNCLISSTLNLSWMTTIAIHIIDASPACIALPNIAERNSVQLGRMAWVANDFW